jgi:hypothetical protein
MTDNEFSNFVQNADPQRILELDSNCFGLAGPLAGVSNHWDIAVAPVEGGMLVQLNGTCVNHDGLECLIPGMVSACVSMEIGGMGCTKARERDGLPPVDPEQLFQLRGY